jgi:hypothetical protein
MNLASPDRARSTRLAGCGPAGIEHGVAAVTATVVLREQLRGLGWAGVALPFGNLLIISRTTETSGGVRREGASTGHTGIGLVR